MPADVVKVYVAEAGVYHERYVEGVYATAEAAMAANPVTADMAASERLRLPSVEPEWHKTGDGEWSNGCDYTRAVSVTEYELEGAG